MYGRRRKKMECISGMEGNRMMMNKDIRNDTLTDACRQASFRITDVEHGSDVSGGSWVMATTSFGWGIHLKLDGDALNFVILGFGVWSGTDWVGLMVVFGLTFLIC
uniref:Ion_trans_2 domain-containing protein n=1 Tax=Panagrellus redivivus TaxID=6233 RepID=A0A7E4W517_PANRE